MMMMGGGRWGTIPTEDSRKQDGILYFTVVKVDAAVDAATDQGIVMETLHDLLQKKGSLLFIIW
jgi:hypothetical protein